MKRCLILAFAVIVGSQTGNAQPVPAPFAMERSAAEPAGAQPSTAGAGSRPFEMKPAGAGSLAPGLGIRTPPEPKRAEIEAPGTVDPAGAQDSQRLRDGRSGTTEAGSSETPGRFILPDAKLHFGGETDSRSWSVFLTQDEAVDAATLTIAYTNAVVVMPEASRLRVSINDEEVVDAAIESPAGVRSLRVPVRKSLLRSGPNRIKVDVTQRHRTDCSVDSTYELWTQIESAGTELSFARMNPNRFRSLDDLPAVGADASGTTTLRVIAPGISGGQLGNRLLRAVQAIALRGRYQHLVVRIMDQPSPQPAPGTLTLALGTASELGGFVNGLLPDGPLRSWAGFVPEPRLGSPAIVVTGGTAADVDAAVEALAAPTLRPAGIPRTEIDTSTWSTPDAPLIGGGRSLRLSNLDIATREFSGRRFKTSFRVALPSDFYAEAYGEALLYLDAAYASVVKPGSHFDVWVNGRITSTLALNAGRGGIFQRYPVKLSLRNFKPGINEIALEGVLLTESDARCLPGSTVPGPNRFVLFDTSELVFPDFGRIGRFPNLAAFSAAAFPYLLSTAPVPIVLGRQDATHYAAAATLLARLAHRAGRPIPVDTMLTHGSVGDRQAIFIGTAGQLAPSLLPVSGIAETVGTSWSNAVEATTARTGEERPYDAVVERFRERQIAPQPQEAVLQDEIPATGTEEIRDRWRQTLGGSAFRREFTSFGGWLNRTFDLSFASLDLFEQSMEPFEPAPQTSVILAQGANPQGGAPWTILVGRREEALEAGVARLTEDRFWRGVSGQLTAFQLQTQRLSTRAPTRTEFVETRPPSLLNARQVVANWLSTNVGIYAAALIALCAVLGTATSIMLKGLGRR